MDREKQPALNVIKGTPDGGRHRVIKHQTLAARQEAELIVTRSRDEAEKIRQEAEEEARSVLEAAAREGEQRALAEFQGHLADIRETRSRLVAEAEKDLLSLAVRIAEKIIGKELSADRKTINSIVSTALKHARQRDRVTIFVNPKDLAVVTAEAERLSAAEKIRILDFAADPSVAVGGCVIETEIGKIDALLETQLKVMEDALLAQANSAEETV